MVEQVSARTLRRHTTRIENQLMLTRVDLQALLHDLGRLEDRLAELGERQRVIESDIEKIQRNIGVIAKHSRANVPVAQEVVAFSPIGGIALTRPLAQDHPLRRV